MHLVGDVLIRPATLADAPGLTRVHVQSWLETYRDLLPESVYDRIPESHQRRLDHWQKCLAGQLPVSVVVAEAPDGIVGFASVEPARDPTMSGYGELDAIYLLRSHQFRGVGPLLLSAAFQMLSKRGFERAYCWMMSGSRTRRFYRSSGAVRNGREKTIQMAGHDISAEMFLWEGLSPFIDLTPRMVRFLPGRMDFVLDELTELLHRAYAPLAEQGQKFLATHQTSDVTLKRLSRGEGWLVYLNTDLIGTVALRPSDPNSICEFYRRPDVWIWGQFAIEPSQQGKNYGKAVMEFVEQRARDLGALELALDTSENATHLIGMYERWGYRFIQYQQWDVTNYRSVVMSKRVG